MFRICILLLGIVAGEHCVLAEDTEFRLLWPQGAPDAKGEADADKPGMWIYPPAGEPNGAAIVICPGGGYFLHATDHEGVQPARYFNRMGVTAFVLRYRLTPYRHPVPLQDAQRALRYVRAHAEEFGIDPHRVGIMGFSAGGHLTSTAVTHFDSGDATADDVVDQQSSRPDFGILGYPVVSFTADFAHKGSAKNLLGENPTDEQLHELSNDEHVTSETPPVFLFHTAEDTGVPALNSVALFTACRKAGVPAELHIYQHGPHGVGLANEHPALSQWISQAGTWLRQNALLVRGERQQVKGEITLNGQPLPWGAVAVTPEDPNAPIGWAMVRNGAFEIPASSGPVPGPCRVIVTNMGAVAPGPTIPDAQTLGKEPLRIQISDRENVFKLEFSE
jgi:acetyl esterase/lipase